MRRIFWLVVFAIITSSAFADASFSVIRSTLTAKKEGRFNSVPVFALNTQTGNTLVIWERRSGANHSILGKLLNREGKRASAVFTLVSSAAISHPAIAYNPAANEFLLAFDDNANLELKHTDIYVMRLNAKGRSLGAASKISTDSVSSTMTNFLPYLVYNSKISKFAAVWDREITPSIGPGNNGLVALLLDASGAPSGNVFLMRPTTVEQNGSSISLWIPIPLDVQVQPNSGKLAIGFVQKISGASGSLADYFFGAVAPDLSNGANFPFQVVNSGHINVSSSSFQWGLRLVFTSSGKGVLAFVDTTKMRIRKISGGGNLAGTQKSAFKRPRSNTKLFFPSLAVTVGSHGTRILLIGVQNPFNDSGEATIWAQLMDGSGLRLGAPVKLEETDSKNTVEESSISVLPHPDDSETYPFLIVYKLSGFKPPGQTFDGSALILLNVKVN